MTTGDLLDATRALLEHERLAGRHDAAHLLAALIDRCVSLGHQRDIRAGQLERALARLTEAADELDHLRRELRLGHSDLVPQHPGPRH